MFLRSSLNVERHVLLGLPRLLLPLDATQFIGYLTYLNLEGYSLFLPVGQGPQGRRYFFLTVHATLKSIRVVTALFRRGQTGRPDRADVF